MVTRRGVKKQYFDVFLGFALLHGPLRIVVLLYEALPKGLLVLELGGEGEHDDAGALLLEKVQFLVVFIDYVGLGH